MIRRIYRYVAADFRLAEASIADLIIGRYDPADKSPEYAAAAACTRDAAEVLSPREYAFAEGIARRVAKRMWTKVWSFEDDLERREIWRADQ